MTILKDISTSDRPREKLLKFGASHLTNTELIALLLNTSGQKDMSVLDLGRSLLGKDDSLRELSTKEVRELTTAKGIGPAKAAVIKAAFELAHRYEEEKSPISKDFHSPADIAAHFISRFRNAKKEIFTLLCFNAHHKLKCEKLISIGSLDSVSSDPREIFTEAFYCHAKGIIMMHNHPSGDPTPSKRDTNITEKLKKGGDLIGIPLLDHIILGDDRYFSFREAGML